MGIAELKDSQEVLDKIAQIEKICGQDVGRNIEALVDISQGGMLATARSIASHPAPSIAIITGFYLPYGNPPAPETDGPVGCAQLAAGLLRVGIPVRIVTDSLCYFAVKIAAIAAGVPESVEFDIVPVNQKENSQQAVASILTRWSSLELPISHAISIERAGPGDDGIVRNMRGQDITAHTPPLHLLFTSSQFISIGIGDGGNELGMGKVPKDVISQNILLGDKIACRVTCDHLIVCGVSNWGATGLLTALSLLRPEWKTAIAFGLNVSTEFSILSTMVDRGPAVDGVKGVQSLSVDNLTWDFHAQVFNQITKLIC